MKRRLPFPLMRTRPTTAFIQATRLKSFQKVAETHQRPSVADSSERRLPMIDICKECRGDASCTVHAASKPPKGNASFVHGRFERPLCPYSECPQWLIGHVNGRTIPERMKQCGER